jgi:outer membrane lipoprotein
MNVVWMLVLSGMVLLAGGCARKDIVPERLEGKVDRDLRYSDLKNDPNAQKGKLVLAGGRVLSAKRLEDGTTRMEVLQLPLSKDLMPTGRETESQGRFVVIDRSGHVSDPAVFDDENTRITTVGEVLGTTTIQIDEAQQEVPELALKHVTVWDWDRATGGYNPYYGYGHPYGWGYGSYYGFPHYW